MTENNKSSTNTLGQN